MRAAVVLCSLVVLVSGVSSAAPKAVLEPSGSDVVLLSSCREYEKMRAGQHADPVQAQACHSFIAGFIMGWENRQNTPVDVLPTQVCLSSGDLDRVIHGYLKDESQGASPMPPNMALIGELEFRFPCKSRQR